MTTTVGELIEALEDLDQGADVRIASQPSWPFSVFEGRVGEADGKVYMGESGQEGFRSSPARRAVGWEAWS